MFAYMLKIVPKGGGTVCYYDLNGNQRTPVFDLVENNSRSALIEYEGRQGIILEIMSEEEQERFKNGSALTD